MITIRFKAPLQPRGVTTPHIVVTPGEVITSETGYLRGHGTYVAEDGTLVASVAGVVERVNKLISVRPVKARYTPEIGDVVLGRIAAVAQDRWKVDIGAHQHATLMLAAVTLPGGTQRRRTYEDQLQMRTLYQEGDLVSTEVQAFHGGGGAGSSVALHTRSLKYGKLQNGQLVTVPPALVKRLKQHFVALPCGVEIIIGTNGLLWITRAGGSGAHTAEHMGAAPEADALQRQRQLHAQTPIEPDVRERIARVHNCVLVLVSLFSAVHPASIMAIYDQSVQMGLDAKALLDTEVVQRLPELCRLELGSPQTQTL